jgi:hypothetical protein
MTAEMTIDVSDCTRTKSNKLDEWMVMELQTVVKLAAKHKATMRMGTWWQNLMSN